MSEEVGKTVAMRGLQSVSGLRVWPNLVMVSNFEAYGLDKIPESGGQPSGD